MQKDNIAAFLQRINYQFKNDNLLLEALTHPSVTKKGSNFNYQRLEFLGDAVLSMIMAELLLANHPQEKEGALSKRQAYLVSGDALYLVAKQIALGEVLQLSVGEEKSGGRNNKRNLENALEALIAAIYLDSDLDKARQFILKNWQEVLQNDAASNPDAVSRLQEITQMRYKKLPEYQTTQSGGNAHQPVFTAEVKVAEKIYQGSGNSKKEAQKKAAEVALDDLG